MRKLYIRMVANGGIWVGAVGSEEVSMGVCHGSAGKGIRCGETADMLQRGRVQPLNPVH